jgi:hypothetical protein
MKVLLLRLPKVVLSKTDMALLLPSFYQGPDLKATKNANSITYKLGATSSHLSQKELKSDRYLKNHIEIR